MSQSSEQLEQETERTRRQLTETLEELRRRLTPGQVVDQLLDYAQDGAAGEFISNLGHEVRRNPLPVTLIGTGIGWLMLANGRSSYGLSRAGSLAAGATRARDTTDDGPGLAERAGDAAAAAGDYARAVGSAVGADGRKAREWLSQTAGQVASVLPSGDDAASMYRNAADTAANLGDSARSGSHRIARFCADEPLVVAGLGLAVGAAIGAALPPSESENRLLGEASEAVKDSVQEQASRISRKAQTVAQATVAAAGKAARDERLTEATTWNAPAAAENEHAPSPTAN
jgi:uncharacterized protein DUF3618